MKFITTLIALLTLISLTAKADGDHHDDAGHNHPHEDGERGHRSVTAGPNGGRVIRSVEPNIEFLVMPDGKVQLTFLDDDGHAIAPAGQNISLVGGSRLNPTELQFEPSGGVLLSTATLPDTKTMPVILTIKVTPDSKAVRERFNVNLGQCPSCEYREYACVCDH